MALKVLPQASTCETDVLALTQPPASLLHGYPLVRAVVLTFGGLLLAYSAGAQLTLNLQLIPETVGFPDANPTTTPMIAATAPVVIRVLVTNLGGDADTTTPWSVSALADGALVSGLTPSPSQT